MREYGTNRSNFWTDHNGQEWRVVTSRRRLKFGKVASHAALRAFVFHRDGYRCKRCGANAVDGPSPYDGRETLFTNTFSGSGYRDYLVVDHMLTLAAGGDSHPDNLQALCQTCNLRKQIEDRANILSYRQVSA